MKIQLKHLLSIMLSLPMLFILGGCASPGGTATSPGVITSPVVSPTSSAPIISPASITPVPTANASVSNGQRIYNITTSASGEPITYTGGPCMMMSVGLTCATCHGPEGHGGTVHFMRQTFDVPSITWPVLTAPDMDHPPYTEETLKRAITQGLDPAGNPLEYPMPRWQMSAQDLNDLVSFIKTLK